MTRFDRVFLTFVGCVACSEGASRAERPRATSPAPATSTTDGGDLPLLPALARARGPAEPVRFLYPANGAEIDTASARELAVRVQGPKESSLVLSLDGARPRPIASGTSKLGELLEPEVALATGAHDLVLAALGSDGVALDPAAGGVASIRVFVGSRPAAAVAPRLVCLGPFGTFYGSSPRITLDFVVASGGPVDADVTIGGARGSRRARAVGRGPFALGAFESGDHQVSLMPVSGSPPMLPGGCAFVLNREIERSP